MQTRCLKCQLFSIVTVGGALQHCSTAHSSGSRRLQHNQASSPAAWAIWAMLGTLLGKLSQVGLDTIVKVEDLSAKLVSSSSKWN